MAAEKQVIVKKRSFGAFLLGFLLGFIFVFVAVAGVGFYAYKKISVKNIESVAGINVPIYEELKTQPLEKLIKLTVDLAKDRSDLSLSKIEETFGFVESLTGKDIPVGIKNSGSGYTFVYSLEDLDSSYLDISVFSTTNVSNLVNEVKDFAQGLSLVDLQKLATFDLPDIPVINDVKNDPLMDAMQHISEKLNFNTLTLRDLKTEFGVDLTTVDALRDFLDVPFNGSGNNNLAYAINNATVANFVGLTKLETETNNEYEDRLQDAGIIGSIANFKINELETKIDDLTIGEILGLKQKHSETNEQFETRINNQKFIYQLREAKINNLQQAIENLNLEEKTLIELEDFGLIKLTDNQRENLPNDVTLTQIIDAYVNSI